MSNIYSSLKLIIVSSSITLSIKKYRGLLRFNYTLLNIISQLLI